MRETSGLFRAAGARSFDLRRDLLQGTQPALRLRSMKLEHLAALAAAWGTLVMAGCGDDEEELALVTAEWSIAGRIDRSDCGAIGADFFEVVFFDLDGLFVAEVEADCTDFVTSFDFVEGTYDVSTRMITARQEGASETLFFDEVEVDRGVEVVLHADFFDVGFP